MNLLVRHKRTAGILLGLVLLLAVPLTIFVAQQKQETRSRASGINPNNNLSFYSKTYSQLLAEKAIEPAREILEVSLFYDESKNPQVQITDLRKLNGYAPYRSQELSENAYAIKVLDSQNQVLETLRFATPNKSIGESFSTDGKIEDDGKKIEGQVIASAQIAFTQTIDWHSKASTIQLISPKGNIASSQSLINIPKINNRANFRVINGADVVLFQKTGGTIKLNMNNPILGFKKAFAQEQPAKKVNIAIVKDASVRQNNFDDYIKKISSYFFSVEPFHARASQINFVPIDTIENLGCLYNPSSGEQYLACNIQSINRQMNNNSIPHDATIIITDLPIPYGGVQGNAVYNSHGIVNVRDIDNANVLGYVFTHELGHALFELRDEYSPLGGGNLTDPDYLGINCYNGGKPNGKWGNLVAINDYQKGCWHENAYAPGKGGIMQNYSYIFNSVSQTAINKKIDEIAGKLTQDTTPPKINALDTRQEENEFQEFITVRLEATDNSGVAWVQWRINNEFLTTSYRKAGDSSYAYTFIFDKKTAPTQEEKDYSVQAAAYDIADNMTKSEKLNVGRKSGKNTPTPTPSLAPAAIPGDYDRNGCISIDDYNKWETDYRSEKVPAATIDIYNEWSYAYTKEQNLCK